MQAVVLVASSTFATHPKRVVVAVETLRPGLPIDLSSKWTLVVNRRAAADLGLTLPRSVVAGAEVR